MMKKIIFLVVALVFAVACVSHAQSNRYNSWVQMTEMNTNIIDNATSYVLTTSTKTAVTVIARANRCSGGYVLNLSTMAIRISPVLFSATSLVAAKSILAQGVVVQGLTTAASAGVAPTSGTTLEGNRFYLGEYSGAYYITLDDDASSTFTGTVAVFDMWK